MQYLEAVGVLREYMDTAPQSERVTAAVRAALEDAPTIEDIGELSDQLSAAEEKIALVRSFVESHTGGRDRYVEGQAILDILDGDA